MTSSIYSGYSVHLSESQEEKEVITCQLQYVIKPASTSTAKAIYILARLHTVSMVILPIHM